MSPYPPVIRVVLWTAALAEVAMAALTGNSYFLLTAVPAFCALGLRRTTP